MRRSFLAIVLMLFGLLAVPSSAATAATADTAGSAASYCGITWGSRAKSVSTMSSAQVVGVRTGRHTCFDRLVIDIAGKAAGYSVRYVDHVRQDGSGIIIPTRGGAALQITVNNHGERYSPAKPRNLSDVSDYRTFRQVVYAGSFEGYTSFGLGVRARLPFRVLVLDGPGTGSRVVVDVAHRW
jgi:hypothetical protein